MRKTRALRATATLAATLFFLEGECALAQDWRLTASYGQASAPRSQGFAEAATLSVARDFPLGSGFSLGIEFTPLFVVNQTRVDLPGRPREVAYAAAVAPVLAWSTLPRRSSVGVRLEGGIGIFRG